MCAMCWFMTLCGFSLALHAQVVDIPVYPHVRVSESHSKALLVHRVEPHYPVDARRKCVHGDVVLQVDVAKDGRVRHVVVVSGSSLLREETERAVRQWVYYPYLLDGVPVEYETRATLKFELPKGACPVSAE